MLYIAQIQDSQTLQVPRSDGVNTPAGALVLTLSRAGFERRLEVVDSSKEPKYYALAVDGLEDLATGEYGYLLEDEAGAVLSQGVAVVGDYHPAPVEFEPDNKTYEYHG